MFLDIFLYIKERVIISLNLKLCFARYDAMLPMILLAALATVSATSSHSSLAQQRGKGAALSSTSRHPASDTVTVGQLQGIRLGHYS